MKNIITFVEFQELKEVKHNVDLTIGDHGYFSDNNAFEMENCEYHFGTCYGYCGEEKFIRRHDGREMTVMYRAHTFKVTGKTLSI